MKKEFPLLFLFIISIFMLYSCAGSQDNRQIYSGIAADNKNSVIGSVVDIIFPDSTNYKLSLRVTEVIADSGSAELVSENDLITLIPLYQVKEGDLEINYSSEVNQHLLNARNLNVGDKISVDIKNMDNKYEWLMLSWNNK